jgi:hypothetical protein
MKDFLYSLIFNRSFILGVIFSIGVLSPYVFSDDNLLEELSELFIKVETGEDIDLTPKSKESTEFNLNKYGKIF